MNEELNDLYCSPNIVRAIKWGRMRWAGHVARMGEERVVYRVLVGKPEGKGPLGRPRRRWVDNNGTDLQEVGCGYMDWIGLAQDRDRWRTVVSAVKNLRVRWNAGNFSTSCKPVNFSRRTLHRGVNKYFMWISVHQYRARPSTQVQARTGNTEVTPKNELSGVHKCSFQYTTYHRMSHTN